MLYRDVLNLIKITSTTTDEYGNSIPTESSRQVFGDEKSVRQSEFYQAMATGLKPTMMFEIRLIDYEDEEILEFKSKRYKIERTYSPDGEKVELICTGLVQK